MLKETNILIIESALTTNSTYPKVTRQGVNEHLCFKQTLVRVDNLVFQNDTFGELQSVSCHNNKTKQMKKILTIILTFLVLEGMAQDIDLKRRYSFAKSYFGVDFSYFYNLQQTSFLNRQNLIQELDRNNFITPAINFGATHFWGHADFFVSVATSSKKIRTDEVDNSIRFRAITGMRIFPLAIIEHTIRPYLSYKFAPIRLNQRDLLGENYKRTQVKSILGAGIAYQTPKVYAYLGYEFIPNSETNIHLSRTQTATSSFPKGLITFGLNYSIEFTNGSYSPPIPQLDSLLRRKNTLGLFFGIGPSSAFPTQNSNYITDLYPFLDDRTMPNIFPEITAGYHFSKHEFVVSVNFRGIRQERDAFAFNQRLKRNSFGLEAYKFLFDYHGFAPFLGGGLLYEDIRLIEIDNGVNLTNDRFTLTTPSLLFGWDIRPGRRADIWLLRTNLRYSPFLELEKNSKKISLQHLEFNFIQAIIYPQRIKKYKELR